LRVAVKESQAREGREVADCRCGLHGITYVDQRY